MSLHEYLYSRTLDKYDPPFYALLFAMMRKADSDNVRIIKAMWSDKFEEFKLRYNSPYGVIPEDKWPVDSDGNPVRPPEVPLEPEYVHLNVTGEAFAKLDRIFRYAMSISEDPEDRCTHAKHLLLLLEDPPE
jgi:hypothetical protein